MPIASDIWSDAPAATAGLGEAEAEDLGNACAALAPEDLDRMREAARILAAEKGLAFRLGSFVGDQTEGLMNAAGRFVLNNSAFSARKIVELSLDRLYDAATRGMDTVALAEEMAATSAGRRHKLISTISGAATGFMGAPGMILDIPLTTGLMLRSIAGIARSYGEDPSTPEGRRACLEVFALTEHRDGPDGQAGYWAARAALSRLAIDGFLRRVTTLLGISFTQKFLTRIVPVIGAATGGALNFSFMDYYQQMARVHFAIRQLERRYDPAQVRDCLDRLVEQERARNRRRSRPQALALPPTPAEAS